MRTTVTIEEIKELRDNWLGYTLTALASGTTRRERIDTWCAGLDAPSEDEAKRLAFTLDILREVEASEHSRDTCRTWFTGANVGADEITPGEAIRQGRFDEVRTSARRLIEDIPYSA